MCFSIGKWKTYCKNPDIEKVENFVPAYLQRFTRNIWQLLDEEEILLSQHNWDDGDDSILKLFGTFMHQEYNSEITSSRFGEYL